MKVFDYSSCFRMSRKALLSLFIVFVLLLGANIGCKKNKSSAPQPDSEGDIISERTTGIKLPQSVQTIPSENSAARNLRENK